MELTKDSCKTMMVEKTDYLTKRGYAITKEQYDYWVERDEYELSEALNSNFDYESEETPKEAILDKEYYNEYSKQSENIHTKIYGTV